VTTLLPAARLVPGRARVVREIRSAGPLARSLRAPVTARGPWLTAVLTTLAARRAVARPLAVVVDDPAGEVPAAAAFLLVRRAGPRTSVTLLGTAAGPLPGGRPPARLLARDDAAADALADAIAGVLARRRGPWTLDLAGLPLGDPTARALAGRLPTATLRTERTRLLVDELLRAERTRDPSAVDRLLPALLAQQADRRDRAFLRVAARLHAAIGAVEVATTPRGGLLTLVDGQDRWPWWAPPAAGVRDEMGAPLVRLTASGWSGRAVSGRAGAR
jgi:hypothetical protein